MGERRMGERRFQKRTYDQPRDDAPRRFSRERAPPSRDRDSDRFQKRDSGRFQKRDSGRFQRRDSEQSFEQRKYPATCASCGEQCEIPFKPRSNKPVYCSSCFRKEGDQESRRPGPSGPANSGLDQINQKLDKIMRALDIK
ncbi:MAG TPA: CxxC-x17-CxxC domain-containing protein [Candidatus Nanoarchaeia archaeon]|nr:CxxC-x17-CxxC domain-containing protein [Candidatus Nanoarchaeia archaeon]